MNKKMACFGEEIVVKPVTICSCGYSPVHCAECKCDEHRAEMLRLHIHHLGEILKHYADVGTQCVCGVSYEECGCVLRRLDKQLDEYKKENAKLMSSLEREQVEKATEQLKRELSQEEPTITGEGVFF